MKHLRVGIDVGGTFTKAVALADRRLIAQARVPTTHDAVHGVADGVVAALAALTAHLGDRAGEVALVAHSTTQATNALLEGDVDPVGIIAMGPAAERVQILRRTAPGAISLAPGKALATATHFVPTCAGVFVEAEFDAALEALRREGAQAFAVTAAFGVDHPEEEALAAGRVRQSGAPVTAGHELTGAYGLEVRTLSAAVNAAILRRMLETAGHVERALAGSLQAPLLVLKGDGGVADMEAFRRSPLTTVLSGPAAGLSGAMALRPRLNALFVEVGGTSTNIGLVLGGQTAMRYVRVGEFSTCIRAADIRVVGVAGGSLIRLAGKRLVDVGPRSAHIAGLPYSCFLDARSLAGARLTLVSPTPGDSSDYAALKLADGRVAAVTPTCAAFALGRGPSEAEGGSVEAARTALAAVAAAMGKSPEALAEQILAKAGAKVVAAAEALLKDQGGVGRRLHVLAGGGAGEVLAPPVAERLRLPWERVEHAAVISSIGAACAMIRLERERTLTNAQAAEIDALVRELEGEALRMGAEPKSLSVHTERVPERGVIRAVAVASLAFAPDAAQGAFATEELAARVQEALPAGARRVEIRTLMETPGYVVFAVAHRPPGLMARTRESLFAVDRRGVVRALPAGSRLVYASCAQLPDCLDEALGAQPNRIGAVLYVVCGHEFVDCSAAEVNAALATARIVLARCPVDAAAAGIIA